MTTIIASRALDMRLIIPEEGRLRASDGRASIADDPWRTVTTEIERTGEHLGQYLTRRLEQIPLEDIDVRTEPLGFEREQEE